MAWCLALVLVACGSTPGVVDGRASVDGAGESVDEMARDTAVEVALDTAPETPGLTRDPGYDQWSYPECQTVNGTCAAGGCHPAILNVSPTACGTYTTVQGGCLPYGTQSPGSICLVRVADGEVIITGEAPYNSAGLEPCPDGNRPSCPNGGGFPDIRTPGYEEWTYPQCQTVDGSCPAWCHTRTDLYVAATRCGPFTLIEDVACFPNDVILAGWFCLRRASDGELIVTENSPYSRVGLDRCPADADFGFPPSPEVPLCPDGGSVDADGGDGAPP
jgi:hypothetical protein